MIQSRTRGLAACGQCASQKKLMKALAMALLMLVANAGVMSAQQTAVSYLSPVYNTSGTPNSGINHWESLSCTSYTVVTSDQTSWGTTGTDSWYVVNANTTINNNVTCAGNVHLILMNGDTLNTQTIVEAGGDGNSFTIYAQDTASCVMGVLNAIGSDGAAGIGSDGYSSASNITINGGKVTATSNGGGAGVGGAGYGGSASNIAINGGIVTATGSYAGIGGGYTGSASNITINGGKVTANGGGSSSGIGGGSGTRASNIFVADNVILKAGSSANPTEIIAHSSITTDIADSLHGKRYATAVEVIIPDTFTVSANVIGNGSVKNAGNYIEGDTVVLVAVADAQYEFDGWSGDTTGLNIADLKADTIVFIAIRDVELTATFVAVTTSVEDVDEVEYVAYSENMDVVVNGVFGHSVEVYDIDGKLVKVIKSAQDAERISVYGAGVYLVRVDNKATLRVVVK